VPHACVFVKHTNACGAAVHVDPAEAYRRAYLGDPNAAMGGVLAVDFAVDAGFAAVVMETYARFGKPLKDAGAPHAPGGFFVEVWIAPRFTDDAVAVIRGAYDPATAKPEAGEPRLGVGGAPAAPKKDWGQRVRLLAVGDMTVAPDPEAKVYRSIAGGMLVQTPDTLGLNEDQWKVVTDRVPTEEEMDDLRLAWLVCKHTKSNAITICREGMVLGNGAGQMSRVMSCRIATWLARENGHSLDGNREQGPGNSGEARRQGGTEARSEEGSQAGPPASVAASDAFFPFPDGPRILIDAGVTALIQPGGGKRDQETIDLCNARGVAMIFTGTRHFRH
jgi:phosphoribosylaminoimidazolecarboxamide formyltransferase/IMP cyclohydrolase